MKIHAISNPIVPKRNDNVNFGRKLKEEEKPEYSKTIHDALDYLGVKNLSMIVHGSSFPSDNRDTAIGSPYSKGADKFVDFIKMNGFNSVQLGPGGSIGKKDNSPYISKVFAKNELFIDLEPLKTKKYANILSEKTYNSLTTKNKETKDKNYNYTDFNKAFNNYDVALKKAYGNFKTKVEAKDKDALKLNKEYQTFKEENKNWVENDGLFKVLKKMHNDKNFEVWNAVDKNLPQGLKDGDKESQRRYKEIMAKHGEDIELNTFTQFLADKQLKDNTKHRKEIGFNYIGDLLVGFNESDVWANQNAFLSGWKLGCPFGGVDNSPQTWGIPVLDPKKLLNKDGSLGESGKLLKEKIAYSLKNYDNVRIDHALGLVDPYIYKENTVHKSANGAVQRDRLWANNVSYMHDIDPDGNFKQVLSKIVLPTFKEFGVDKNEAVWEDLGSTTPAFDWVYHNQENLPGITQTLWSRAENAPRKENWSLVVSHDFEPASEMVQKDWVRNSDAWNVDYLSGYLNPDPATSQRRNDYKNEIINSKQSRVDSKFTELFRGTKNLQIMFSDFLGINKTYNVGGQDNKDNWKLRVDNDFEDDYYRSLQDENSYALNMPEILAQAVRAKSGMEVAKISGDAYKANAKRTELDNKLNPLLEKLDSFKDILKEKEVEEVKVKSTKKTKKMAESKPQVETTTKANSTVSNPIENKKTEDKKSLNKAGATLGIVVGMAALYKIGKAIVNKFRHKKEEQQPQPQVVEEQEFVPEHIKLKVKVEA